MANTTYAVIFKARIADLDATYPAAARRLRELALQEYGCMDFVSVTEGDLEISISYWESLNDIRRWKQNAEHLQAQATGQAQWFREYQVEVVEIVRKYGFQKR